MQSQENHQKILDLITDNLELPSPPAVAVKILDAVQNKESALKDIADIISADPALTAKMLRVANSGYYSRGGPISNIQRAMTILGTNVIKNIALSFVIAESFNQEDKLTFDFDLFWKRSVISAVAADLLATKLEQKNDDLFITALLQDIGSLIIAMSKADEYNRIFNDCEIFGYSLVEVEQKAFKFDHSQVSYALLQHWQLPDEITIPTLFHHRPKAAPEDIAQTASFLHYGARFSQLLTSDEIATNTRIVSDEISTAYNLDNKSVSELVDDIALAAKTMLESFELPPGDLKPYTQILQEANDHLSSINLNQAQLVLEMQEAKMKAERMSKELQDANSRLKDLVYRDGLTGLYNHRFFQESLSQELARANRYRTSVSLILFDIDHFKKVNDSYGHQAGDQVLMNIARAVSSSIRPTDIIARYGGEEFAVILPETSPAGAKVFAARLRRCVEGIATLVKGQLIYVTVSAGTASFGPDNNKRCKDALINAADKGLYLSKQNGRNLVTPVEVTELD